MTKEDYNLLKSLILSYYNDIARKNSVNMLKNMLIKESKLLDIIVYQIVSFYRVNRRINSSFMRALFTIHSKNIIFDDPSTINAFMTQERSDRLLDYILSKSSF